MFSTTLFGTLVIVFLTGILLSKLVAQQTESTSQPVVVTVPEIPEQNATVIKPSELGLTGDVRKIDSVTSNVSLEDAGADSFTDVYAVRGLTNTPNFSKQALTLYVDDVPSASTFTNFTELGQLQSVELIRGPQADLVGKNAE